MNEKLAALKEAQTHLKAAIDILTKVLEHGPGGVTTDAGGGSTPPPPPPGGGGGAN